MIDQCIMTLSIGSKKLFVLLLLFFLGGGLTFQVPTHILCYINRFINLSIHDIKGHVFSVYLTKLYHEVRLVNLKKVSDVKHCNSCHKTLFNTFTIISDIILLTNYMETISQWTLSREKKLFLKHLQSTDMQKYNKW